MRRWIHERRDYLICCFCLLPDYWCAGFHLPWSSFPLFGCFWRIVRFFHSDRSTDFRRSSVHFHYGHRIFCSGWKFDDSGRDFQANCKFCQLSGGKRARRYESCSGIGMCLFCCPVWFCSGHGYCHWHDALWRYGEAWLSRGQDSWPSGCIWRSWPDHSPFDYHGDLLYSYRGLCGKHV